MGERAQEVTNVFATRDRMRVLHEQSQAAHHRFLEAYGRGDQEAMRHAASERSAINLEIIGLLSSMQERLRANRR